MHARSDDVFGGSVFTKEVLDTERGKRAKESGEKERAKRGREEGRHIS